MITELKAHNFKSWQATGEIRFAPLTGFFGANNSGKTSILQLLLLLKQTAEQQPPEWNEPLYFGDGGSPVNLVDFDTVIHLHNLTVDLGITLSWKLTEGKQIAGYSADSLSFSTNIIKNLEQSELRDFRYKLDYGPTFGIDWTSQENPVTPRGYLIGRREHMTISRNAYVDPFRCYGIVNPAVYEDPFLDLQTAFENLFSRVRYLGPRREDPRHSYSWRSSHPKDVGQRGQNMIASILSGRVRLLSVEEQILNWLQQLELIDSYDLHPTSGGSEYDFLIKQYKNGPEVRFTDIGFGVSQVLPLIAQCYYAPEGSILILENPEAHLHPKAQSELADVFIDVVKNRNIQIILESHSEHLLLRLMRRIAEEEISEKQTAFHFCKIEDGNSQAEQLKVDEYGNISNWPKNFFGDEMGDVVEKTKAEMKRRKANK